MYFSMAIVTGAFIVWFCIYTVHLVIYDPDLLFIIFVILPLMYLGVRVLINYLAEKWWDNGN